MYILKPEMAYELKDTDKKIYLESPDFLNDTEYIATIGDTVSYTHLTLPTILRV